MVLLKKYLNNFNFKRIWCFSFFLLFIIAIYSINVHAQQIASASGDGSFVCVLPSIDDNFVKNFNLLVKSCL